MRPIDADKLFRDIPLKVCVPCPFGEEKECRDCVIDKVMEMVDDAPTVEPASPWRRVEEPPKEHMWCFVYTDEPEMIMPIRIAFYVASCTGKGNWYHYESGEDIDDEVDYWAPMYLEGPDLEGPDIDKDLPWPIEPPKEEK
jgi:hypothetical protein